MMLKLLALLAASTAIALPAQAQTLVYRIEGLIPGKFTATFQFEANRTPSIVLPGSVRYNGVPITYTLPNSTTPITESAPFDGVTFQNAQNQGGLFYGYLDGATGFNNRIQLFGAPLFTGNTSAPTLLTGEFLLSDIPPNGSPLQPNYRLTVSALTSAVPEPASWAMMIAGFGVVGGALRRRRVSVRFA
jgi:hypothetical protein